MTPVTAAPQVPQVVQLLVVLMVVALPLVLGMRAIWRSGGER